MSNVHGQGGGYKRWKWKRAAIGGVGTQVPGAAVAVASARPNVLPKR